MDLFDNPFYILKATPRDNRQRIMELSDESSLTFDVSESMHARSELSNPRKRLTAEISWLPGLAPKRASYVLTTLENSVVDIFGIENLTTLAKANLFAAAILRLLEYSPAEITRWILEIAVAFESIDKQELCMMLNEERIAAGFPEITDSAAIEAEIQERRLYYRQVIRIALDRLSATVLVEVVTKIVEDATNFGEKHGPILVDDLIDAYEVHAQEFLEKEESNIELLVERLAEAAEANISDSELSSIVNDLIRIVENWDMIAQPIQISARSRGLDHDASTRVAHLVRGIAVDLYNTHGKLDYAQQLINMLQEVFAEVIEVAERTAEDAGILDGISEQYESIKEDANNQYEKWKHEITYEADLGLLFKDKLRISPQGIEWKGCTLALDSITQVSWGGTRSSYNGIPTGTTYTIFCGSSKGNISIQLSKEKIYTDFIACLWKSVCVRLLTDLLKDLRNGKKYRFAKIIVTDLGIELERWKMFSSNERVFCYWRELTIWNDAGVFCIASKDDCKLSAELSYQEVNNTHILEAAIRAFWKHGGERLSCILED